jgi:hypothetical protein
MSKMHFRDGTGSVNRFSVDIATGGLQANRRPSTLHSNR